MIDLTKIGTHDPRKFFRPIFCHGGGASEGRLTLEKDRFYILATKERVSIPVHLSAEMVPFSHHVGELRVRALTKPKLHPEPPLKTLNPKPN